MGKGQVKWRDCSAAFPLTSLLLIAVPLNDNDEGDFIQEIASWEKSSGSEFGAWRKGKAWVDVRK